MSSAWWWWQGQVPKEPPSLAVTLIQEIPPTPPDAPDVEVEAPPEPEPEVLPVVEVEATAIEPTPQLEELPPQEEYEAVRPWMPRAWRFRPAKPKLQPQQQPQPTPKPPPNPTPPPQASVVMAPQIDAALCPPPKYPRRARRCQWEGVAQLLVTVNAEGKPVAIQVQVSSGHEILDQAAVDAVWGWHFHPAKRDGKVEAGQLLVPIRFEIRSGRG